MGNQDESLFGTVPDWKIELSTRGKLQAQAAGRRIQEIVGPNNPVLFYVSPYQRTKQTLQELQSQLSSQTMHNTLFTREEPRLREQDFGNFQDPQLIQQYKRERPKFGRFFYRFPHGGESGADVFDRVSAFCGTFLQDIEQCGEAATDATAVFVTHGITARLFIMKWLHWTVEDFEQLHNPPNCGILLLVRSEDGTSYRLTDTSRELIKAPVEEGIGRALRIGMVLKNRKRFKRELSLDERRAFDSLSETAWGI
jgi:broad specificity phosphatase PhoE